MSRLPVASGSQAFRTGDVPTTDRFFVQVYDKLCRLASVVRRPEASPELDATALVHEAYLHLQPCDDLDVTCEQHFLRLAARAMRQVLARNARRRQAQKRGGTSLTMSLHHLSLGREPSLVDALAVKQALTVLGRLHPRRARVVKYRYYDGFTVVETARVLGISTATVKRDWRAARTWLRAYLESSD